MTMAISANYTIPVNVNGFSCKNCTEVEEAKKFIDPAHPKSGPFGIDAKSDPTVTSSPRRPTRRRFGYVCSGLEPDPKPPRRYDRNRLTPGYSRLAQETISRPK